MIKSVFLHEFKKAGAVTLDVYVLWYKTLNLWNMNTDEIIHFQSIEEAFEYEIKGKAIKDIIAEADMSLFDMVLDGGSGSGSPKQTFKFGHASGNSKGDGVGEEWKSALPARMNNKIKVKSEDEAIKVFRNEFNNSKIEHGIAIDDNGYVHNYSHGDSTSVYINARGKGNLIVHNHPSGGHFSDSDLLSIARTGERGIIATTPKGYYRVDKGTHFKAESFARGVKNARMVGTSYDDAVDKWLKKNQTKYGYKYTNVKDKKVKTPAPKIVFDAKGQGSLF